MNIFFLSICPTLCAALHADVHVNKMITETTQLLYSVWTMLYGKPPPLLKQYFAEHPVTPTQEKTYGLKYAQPKGLSNPNHPCAKWARHKKEHYDWLCRLGLELCKRKREIYNKKPPHSCEIHIKILQQAGFPGGPTPPIPTVNVATKGIHPTFDYVALAGPKKYDHAVKAYRYFYAKTKIVESLKPKDVRTFKVNIYYNKQRVYPKKLRKHIKKAIKHEQKQGRLANEITI